MENFDSIKNFFQYADEETKAEIATLEKALKQSSLMTNLANHDGMKKLIETCESSAKRLNLTLQEQEIMTETDKIKRAAIKAQRDTFIWFVKIFSLAQSRSEAAEKKVEAIKQATGL